MRKAVVGNMQPKCYVRARPRKISLTETYYYKAEIQDSTNFQFKKADGEIKVDFIYDGERRDGRWKIRQFLDDLSKQSKLLRRLERTLRWFFGLRLIAWIVRVTGLAWLWENFVGLLLGREPGGKFFGIAAIKDAAKCGQGCRTARAGHLVLYGYEPFSFTPEWPRQRVVPLDISLEWLSRNLERTQQASLTYKYEPKGPPALSVHPPAVKLSDVGWDRTDERHSNLDEILRFQIELAIDAGQPGIGEDDELPAKTVERWWRKLHPGEAKEKVDCEQDRQVRLIDGLDNGLAIEQALYDLATHCGGYILLQIRKSNDDGGANLQQVKRRLLQIALSKGLVFAPLLKPYRRSIDDFDVYVVPVPSVPPRWYEERPKLHGAFYKNKLWVSAGGSRPLQRIISITALGENVVTDLSKTLAALANSEGGNVLLRVADELNFNDDDCRNLIRRACLSCWPPLDMNLIWSKRSAGTQQWLVEVERRSPEIHSVGGVIYRWENGQAASLPQTSDAEIDRIYQFFKDRCNPSYPVVEPLPIVYYADVRGARFDAREHYGSTYSREDESLRLTDSAAFELGKDHTYQAVLTFVFNRPVELYAQVDLAGRIHIDLKGKLLSGLDVAYFDALGELQTDPIIEKKSQIVITLDHIALRQVFKRREFHAQRHLNFEGVRPDDQRRLDDIKGMLADLGLENIKQEESEPWLAHLVEPPTMKEIMEKWGGYMIRAERSDGLKVLLEITGGSQGFERERTEGERTDYTWVESGQVHITIQGSIEGELRDAQELSKLLNDLQRLLKERFSYVRAQVV